MTTEKPETVAVGSDGLLALPPHTRKLVDATIMALCHACDGDFSDYCEDSDFGNELCEWLHAQKNRITTRG